MRSNKEFASFRVAIDAMVDEQTSISETSAFKVSKQWREKTFWLDFIRDFSDEQLKLIRLHVGLIVGKPWFFYAKSPVNNFTDAQKSNEYPVADYLNLIKTLPKRLHGKEPLNHPLVKKVGIIWKNRLITNDLLRYQRTVTNLYASGLLDAVEDPLVVEIGGGYGGLAHQMMRGLAGIRCYVIFDLPQMLYWSSVFLRINNPDLKIYLYDKKSFDTQGIDDILANYDVALLPFYLVARLTHMPAIDIAINMQSMSEMAVIQTRSYCQFLANNLRGWFYSENPNQTPGNKEMQVDLFDVFSEYFEIKPDTNFWKTPDNQKDWWVMFPYFCCGPNTRIQLRKKFHIITQYYTVSVDGTKCVLETSR